MKLNFQISKLNLRFQINSNGFSRDRSFGQDTIKMERVQSQKSIGYHGLDAVLLDPYLFMYSVPYFRMNLTLMLNK